ncbi:MAG: NAD(P)-dependent oxidoreductase [Actinomycetota bacterium]
MSRVTVLGLGAMGSRMAARIADAGHEVTVWNRSRSAVDRIAAVDGVSAAATARSAVRDAEVVVAVVADDDASRELWLDADHGALAAVPAGAVVAEASTLSPGWVTELGSAVEAAGAAFVETPVVGSRPQAEAGALVTLAGGEGDVIDRIRPVLDAYSGAVRPLGPLGSAATMKLAINTLFASQVVVYAEIAGLLDRSTLPTQASIEVLAGLPITSPGLQRILGLITERDFAPNFPIPLVAKDLRYLTDLAADLDAPTPMARAALVAFEEAASDERAELDISGITAGYLAG